MNEPQGRTFLKRGGKSTGHTAFAASLKHESKGCCMEKRCAGPGHVTRLESMYPPRTGTLLWDHSPMQGHWSPVLMETLIQLL